MNLGRVLRALGDITAARAALEAATAWHREAGGGEQAALGECLLAAMDAADQVPGAEERLVAILDEARRTDDAPVEVFALDALARIAATAGDASTARALGEEADRRMEAAAHVIRTSTEPTYARWGSTAGPDVSLAAMTASPGSAARRARLPRSFNTRKPTRPPITTAIPTTCQGRTLSSSNRNDQTTARAGWATCAIPIVPIWMVRWANTSRPWAATPVRNIRTSVYAHPLPLISNISPLAIANGSTATAAIGLMVAMNVATSMSRRKWRVATTYPTHRNIASTPNTFPRRDASPFAGAFRSTMAAPPKASRANSRARGWLYSRKSLAPIGTIRKGESEPISAALATLLFVAPTKNVARFTPKNTPGMNACRTWRSVTLRPVRRR